MQKEAATQAFEFDESFLFLKKIFSDNIMGIGVYSSPDFTLLKANQAYLDFLPEPFNRKEKAIGLRLQDIIPNWKGSRGQKRWSKMAETGESIYVTEFKDIIGVGKNNYCDNTLVPIVKDGAVKYIVSMLVDVTEKVLSVEYIKDQIKLSQQREKQLEAIIENMSDALFIADKNCQSIRMNKTARNLFPLHYSTRTLEDIFHLAQYFDLSGKRIEWEDMPSNRIIRGEDVKQDRIMIKTPIGDLYVDISGKAIKDDDGQTETLVMCCRDVTDRVKYEKNLEHDLKMKDEFLSLVSHEFKTPLTVINSAIQAMELLCWHELSVKAKSFINKIRQNSFRQLRLVNNLLDITRINAGYIKINKKNLDIVFLTKAITESVYLYANQKGIRLVFTSTFGQKIIGIDDEKYERILLNLLSNAIKFTPKGKSVTVKLSSVKSFVRIEVIDKGPGIPEDKLELIFERFGQVDSSLSRQAEGTGIGLSLVKLFTTALDGKIAVKSEPGKGSTFTLLLPAAKMQEQLETENLKDIADKRLIQATAIEFSDIYLI